MLNQLIKDLTLNERALLQFAFDTESTEYILKNGFYIGVHCVNVPGLTPIETKGCWSYGKQTT